MENNIEIKLSDNQKELVLRTGTALAPVQLVKLTESGNIESPSRFHANRPGVADKSVVTFSREKMEIVFSADPEHPLASKVVGKLLINSDLKKFHINTDKMWTTQELAKFIKMNKTFFKDADKVPQLVSDLLKFKAQINTDIENSNDGRGNSKVMQDRKTVHTMPNDFVLQMPIFIGEKSKSFKVEIGVDSTDSTIEFWLESSELQDIIIKERDRIIDLEISKFEGLIIIEQ